MMRTVMILALGVCSMAQAEEAKKVPAALNFTMKDIDGKDVDLKAFHGKVVLFVNVASECGLTGQYKGLQELYEKYRKDGLVIVGVPANEFGKQEPGSNAEIKAFCSKEYKVTFPMMAKVVVKGTGTCPLYEHLTTKTDKKFQGPVKWNFAKFLVGRGGEVVGRFEPTTEPDAAELMKAIEAELKAK